MHSAALTVSELARSTQVPLARIKFYLREGLLPSGDLAAEKRAYYGQHHAQRLRLIHVLREVAGLGIPAIRSVCGVLDAEGTDLSGAIRRVLDVLGHRQPKRSALSAPALARAHTELSSFLRARGFRVRARSPALTELARALVGLRDVLGDELSPEVFGPYAEAMLALADRDFVATGHLLQDRARAGLAATYGTVLWEPVLVLLRRLAIEHVASQRLRPTPARARRKVGR